MKTFKKIMFYVIVSPFILMVSPICIISFFGYLIICGFFNLFGKFEQWYFDKEFMEHNRKTIKQFLNR